MELLYVWINQSKNGVFTNQGVNFCPEFNFIVEQQENAWTLFEDPKWKGRTSIFKDDIVENLTAIVGENGSGKTTLLDYIMRMRCFAPKKLEDDKEYEKLKEMQNAESLCVYIFRENGKPTIYHNFEDGFVNKTEYDVKNMSDQDLCKSVLTNDTDFRDVFRIYITNSNCGSTQIDVVGKRQKLDEVALTPKGISTIASVYYNKLLGIQ